MKENEIKALWMAQYLGQDVLITALESKIQLTPNSLYEVVKYDTKTWCHLQLRTIDQLTDEEIRIIADMNGWNSPEITKDRYEERLLQYKVDLPAICNPRMRHRHLKTVFDYLILIGILLPFTFLNENNRPVTLQPAEIIAKGWAKVLIQK